MQLDGKKAKRIALDRRGHVRALKPFRQVPDRRTPETSSYQLVFISG